MRITIKYPADYNLELFSANHYQKAEETIKDCGKGYTTCTYDILVTDKISLKASYKKKFSFKYSLFKKDWLTNAFFSVVSFDWWIPEQIITVDLKARENSEINILLDYDYISNSMNGFINKLKIQSIDSKKAFTKAIKTDKTDKSTKLLLQISLALGMLFNLLIYGIAIAYLLLSIFDYRFYTFKSNPILDFAVIFMVSLLLFINLIRFFIKHKDILNFLDNTKCN